MSGEEFCNCLCPMWGHVERGVCTSDATTTLHFSRSVIGPCDVPMCRACAEDVAQQASDRAAVKADA